MSPVIRTLIPCLSITAKGDPLSFTLHDVSYSITPDSHANPVTFSLFFAYTESRFPGDFHLRIHRESDHHCVHFTSDFPAVITPDPTVVVGQPIEFTDVRFETPGQYAIVLYWRYEVVGQTYFEVRDHHGR